MCGIVGIYAFAHDAPAVSSPLIDAMRDTMVHRGPDGAGTWVSDDQRIGLGHRRLSIIDLSTAAAQPMSDATGELWLVFNGEIYNHGALRSELQGLGHQFRTDHSDTGSHSPRFPAVGHRLRQPLSRHVCIRYGTCAPETSGLCATA